MSNNSRATLALCISVAALVVALIGEFVVYKVNQHSVNQNKKSIARINNERTARLSEIKESGLILCSTLETVKASLRQDLTFSYIQGLKEAKQELKSGLITKSEYNEAIRVSKKVIKKYLVSLAPYDCNNLPSTKFKDARKKEPTKTIST